MKVAWWFSDFGALHALSKKTRLWEIGNDNILFLTSSRKYKTGPKNGTQTIQFRLQDAYFMKDNKILDPTSPLELLLSTDVAMLELLNQKNGVYVALIHHHTINHTSQ